MPTPNKGRSFIETRVFFHISILWLFDVSPKSSIDLMRFFNMSELYFESKNCGDENIGKATKNARKNIIRWAVIFLNKVFFPFSTPLLLVLYIKINANSATPTLAAQIPLVPLRMIIKNKK